MTPSPPHGYSHHPIGITRREMLQVGYSGLLGIGLPSLFARQAAQAAMSRSSEKGKRKPKSVILVFLTIALAPGKSNGFIYFAF